MIVIEAVIVSLLGAALGIAIGILFGWAMQQALADLGFSVFAVPYGLLGVFAVIAALLGMVAAIAPAIRASRIRCWRRSRTSEEGGRGTPPIRWPACLD